VSATLAYIAAGVVGLWGVAHVLPTARVVHGYDDTSHDNRLVITQEWIAERMTMWFIAVVVVIATALGGSNQGLTDWVYRASAIMLVALAGLTTVTGARTPVGPEALSISRPRISLGSPLGRAPGNSGVRPAARAP
jgi:hypothetical protein